jgi:hypothetical protein
LQTVLIVSPPDAQEASAYRRPLAHAAYRIGEDSSLLRRNLPLQARGGLLCISDRTIPVIGNPEKLCQGILRECSRRSCQSVLLDFEEPPQQDRMIFVQMLEQQLSANHKTLYLPESYMDLAPGAVGLICTALSGGTLEQRLKDAVEHRGRADPLALDVQRLRMDFTLPARSGEGIPLSREAFQALFRRENPSVFFSPELCARYFTYTQNGVLHFVLFDDAETLRRKVSLGSSLGFSAAFFLWPEVADLAPALFV